MFDTEKLEEQLSERNTEQEAVAEPDPRADRPGRAGIRIGVDTGGTFTDLVILKDGEISILKVASTPSQPSEAVIRGLDQVAGVEQGLLIQHGSTVATNALLERKGARTLLLTTHGFEDVIEIGRQNRPALYHLGPSRPVTLVEGRFRIGVKERLAWDGSILIALEDKSLNWIVNRIEQLKPEAVAVALLHSYMNPEHERRLGQALQNSQIPVSLSHEVLPEFREFERTAATVINAYLSPIMSSYLATLTQAEIVKQGRLSIMQSNGGSISPEAAARFPVNTLFSGPAGGVNGAFEASRQAGYDHIITFDMGGTSTDVSLCDGRVATTREAQIGGLPVPVQMIDIHTVGAGGGSLVWVDEGGLLRVGPQSAGAEPGPVCYGKGEKVTVTDANLFLGLLEPDWFLGGSFPLHPEKVRPALVELAGQLGSGTEDADLVELCRGIRRIAETQMESALRVISLEKGFDTREFSLVSFGGSGGLHACDLARSLLIPRVIVPLNPGVLSALGVLVADIAKDASRTVLLPAGSKETEAEMEEVFRERESTLLEEMAAEGFPRQQVKLERSIDARYLGQSWELNIPSEGDYVKRFHRRHEQAYGYANSRQPIEIVTLRVRAAARYGSIDLPKFELSSEDPKEAFLQKKHLRFHSGSEATSFYVRDRLQPGNRLQGPAIILEYSATTFVPEDFSGRVDEFRNLIFEPVQ